MRVLVAHNRYRSAQPSGEDTVVDQEVAALRRQGHEVCRYERRSDDIETMGLGDKLLVPARVVWSRHEADVFAQALRKFRPEVVHFHNTFPLLSVAPVWRTHAMGIPVVATLHNFRLSCAAGTFFREGDHCVDCLGGCIAPALRHRCYRGSFLATAPLAAAIRIHAGAHTWARSVDTFITMSEFASDLMVRSGLPLSQIVVKPHFVPHPTRVRIGSGDGGAYLGRLSPEKGPDWLLNAWNVALGPLDVIGDGPLRQELERASEAKGIDWRFHGYLPRDKALDKVAEARYLIMPSQFFETFGVAAVEAMSRGVPVIAPRMGVLPEVVEDGITGLLYEYGSVWSMQSAVSQISDPNTAIRLGRQASARYAARYSESKGVEALESIYAQAIDRVHRRLGRTTQRPH